MKSEMTVISISKQNRDALREKGGKGDTYNDVITRILKEVKIGDNK